MSDNQESSGLTGFLFGFLVGLTAGAATAIILAPSSGMDTRTQLQRRAAETCDTFGKRVAEVKQMAADLAGDLKEDVGEWAQRTREKLSQNLVRETRTRVEEALSPN